MKITTTLSTILIFTTFLAYAQNTAVIKTTSPGIHGELKKWHRITIAFEADETSENGIPNPFLDRRLDVTFTHSASGKNLTVPGHYAADGFAGETSAASGKIWRAHFAPPQTGEWTYRARFLKGTNVAVSDDLKPFEPAALNGNVDGIVTGKFTIAKTDKTGRDNRAHGMLEYDGTRYLRWAETGKYFFKQGPDAPENLFAYSDFDGDFKNDGHKDNFIKTYNPHLKDWKNGDPAWQNGKGKGLIGALNYLASEGLNTVSFITMNINGDDQNVFPYTDFKERKRLDVSRLDQWEVIMNHADKLGLHLHFKTQEAENDKLLDGGALGTERKLYYRELISRFGHHLALNWNLGEENNGQTDAQRIAMAKYFHDLDPYPRNIVIHTYPNEKNKIHTPLLGKKSELTGLSMQGSDPKFEDIHRDVLEWIKKSTEAGKPWVVACDEPGSAQEGITTDDDDTKDPSGKGNYSAARHKALWGVLLAGGAGTEWYFGYKFKDSDLTLQDFRSRDRWWDYCRHALTFFSENAIPFHEMENHNMLIGNEPNGNQAGYCFANPGHTYVVYLTEGIARDLLLEATSTFTVHWFDPRNGGKLQLGSIKEMTGGVASSLGTSPSDPDKDWVVLVRKK